MYIYHVLIVFNFHSSSKLLLDLCLSKLHILSVFYNQSLIYAAHIVLSVEPSTGSQLTHQGHKLKIILALFILDHVFMFMKTW